MFILLLTHAKYFSVEREADVYIETENSQTATVIASIVCSIVFVTIGVLLGVVGLYLIQRVRGRSSVLLYLKVK